MTTNYSLGSGVTASEIILALDSSDPLHRAHIGQVWSLCRAGMRYANEDGDTLGAALAAAMKGPAPIPDHARGWVTRWENCPAHIADALRWARGVESQA